MLTSRRLVSSLATCLLAITGCASDDLAPDDPAADPAADPVDALAAPADIADALAQLPDAVVQHATPDGVPLHVTGDLGHVAALRSSDPAAIEAALRPTLPALLAPFRLQAAAVALREARRDAHGAYHLRYAQRHAGEDVVGGDLVIHVDARGTVYAINGTARGDLSPKLGAAPIGAAAALARVAQHPDHAGLTTRHVRTVYLIAPGGTTQAYEIEATGTRGADPVRDLVYVDVDTGAIAAVHPQIHHARDRRTHDVQTTTSLPGLLRRTETGAPTGDVDVDAAHDNTGHTYDAYQHLFGRDSLDGAGAVLTSSVHYAKNYCNAFWNGTQMIYGDGNTGQDCGPLARKLDVVAHEFTHGVTANASALNYSGESGGINESFSDIFAAVTEAYVDGGKTGTLVLSPKVWLLGDGALSAADMRDLCDPASDNYSKDLWYAGIGGVDPHSSSGVGNLMFCLLTRGGSHPRGKTDVVVPAIGMEKAIRLAYKAQTDHLIPNADYAMYRFAMEHAAIELGYDASVRDAVSAAFTAVGVTASTPIPSPTVLKNGVAKLVDLVAGEPRYWTIVVPPDIAALTVKTSGGSGDVSLYVREGNEPSSTSNLCGSSTAWSNTETCVITNPAAGTYYVLTAGTATNVGLVASYTAASGDPYFYGTSVLGLAGAQGSARYWRVHAGGRQVVSVKMANGTGDADLYTRFGSRPTLTEYGCRPYTTGNAESCTSTSSDVGDHYIMVRGYKAYADVSLVISY